MDDQSRRLYAIPPAVFQHLIKSFHAASPESAGLLSSRESKRPAAVDPGLIIRITAQFLIVLILEGSEVTFRQIIYNDRGMVRIEQFRRLQTAFPGTYIDSIHFRVMNSCQTRSLFFPDRLVSTADVPGFLIACCLPVPDQIDLHKTPPIRTARTTASGIASSHNCRKYPARSPVMPPN